MMSFELLLDPSTDARIRAQWDTLVAAGLPSLARHTGASNAPHITLLAARSVDARLTSVATAAHEQLLPVELAIGDFAVFGRPPSGLVLARLVVVSQRLQHVQSYVHQHAAGLTGLSAVTGVDAWVPHITLASRLTPPQLAEAIRVLGEEHPARHDLTPPASRAASAAALRHWNGDTRTVTVILPATPVPPDTARTILAE